MKDRPSVVAIVPARAGSRSIPNKNIELLAGEPLISHTIVTALSAESVSRVVVSTDSAEIAEVARFFGAQVPFIRPEELAQDNTPGIVPILHAVEWFERSEDYRPEYVIMLQPTSPLRTSEDIEAAIHLALEVQADAVVSVGPVSQHPFWMKNVTDDGRLTDFLSLDRAYVRRQDLPPAYALNGAIYLANRALLLDKETWYTDRTYAYIMPVERSLDIDTPWDLYLANLILKDRARHERD